MKSILLMGALGRELVVLSSFAALSCGLAAVISCSSFSLPWSALSFFANLNNGTAAFEQAVGGGFGETAARALSD
jgi:hypothetical protein